MRTVQTVVFLGLLVGSFLLPAHGAENVAGQDPATGQPPPPGKIQVRDTTPRFSLREILKLADLSEAQKKRILALQAEYRLKLADIAVKKIEITPETLYVDNPFDPSGGVKKFHELSPADKAIVGDRERKRLARRMEDEFAAQVWQVLSCQQRRSLILLALQAPSQLEGGRETIREMVDDYQIQHGIVITLDTEVLRQDKLDPEMVWFPTSLHGTTLDSSLRLALEPLGATHLVRGDTLLITTKAEAQQLLREGAEDPATFPSPAKAARMKQITAALKEPVPTKIRGVPLQGIIERLGDLGKVQVVFDFGCFVPGMVPLDHPALTLDLKPVPLEKALMQLLAPHGLTFIVRDEVIMVVPAKKDRPADAARPPRPEYLSGKITVSSSTTRILGPLDKEGRVDYAAAVNARYSRGVTPENNALTALWEVCGPSEITTANRSRYFQLLGVKPLPVEGPYLLSVEEVAKARGEKPADWYDWRAKNLDPAEQSPWAADEFPFAAAWLKANEAFLAKARLAAGRSRCYSPWVKGSPDAPLAGTLLPDTACLRECHALLVTHGMMCMRAGRRAECWDDLLASHRLVRLCGQGPSLVHQLLAQNLNGLTCRATAALACRGKLTSDQIARCLADLDALPPLPRTRDCLDVAERYDFLDAVSRVARGGPAELERIVTSCNRLANAAKSPAEEKIQPASSKPAHWLRNETVDWDEVMHDGNRWFDLLVAAADKPTWRERVDMAWTVDKKLWDELDHLAGGGDAKKLAILNLFLGTVDPKIGSLQMFEFMAGMLTPDGRMACFRECREEANLQLARLSLALAAYQAARGEYPARLEELAPRYLKTLPKDPFSAAAFCYERQSKGYLLYSVGWNGKDDGGRDQQSDPPGDDIVIRVPPLAPAQPAKKPAPISQRP